MINCDTKEKNHNAYRFAVLGCISVWLNGVSSAYAYVNADISYTFGMPLFDYGLREIEVMGLQSYVSFASNSYTFEFSQGLALSNNELTLPLRTRIKRRTIPVSGNDSLINPNGFKGSYQPYVGLYLNSLARPTSMLLEPGLQYVATDACTPYAGYRVALPTPNEHTDNVTEALHFINAGFHYYFFNRRQPVHDMNRFGSRYTLYLQPDAILGLDDGIPFLFTMNCGMALSKYLALQIRLSANRSVVYQAVPTGYSLTKTAGHDSNSGLLFLELSPGGRRDNPQRTGSSVHYGLYSALTLNY